MTIETESRQEISQPQPAAVTPTVEFHNVSKFYGDVLGVNRVNLIDSSWHHEPGRSERLRQDDADEPDDGPDSPDVRRHPVLGLTPQIPNVSFAPSATARSSIHSPKASPAGSSSSTL